MLTRVISAVIIAPIVIALFIFLSNDLLLLVLSAMSALLSYETAMIYQLKKSWIALYIGLSFFITLLFANSDFSNILILMAVAVWGLSWAWIVGFRTVGQAKPALGMLSSLLLFPACAIALFLLRADWGYAIIIVLLLMVWSIDIVGMLVGRKWGRSKLIPTISPNKTWVGFYAQVTVGLLWSVVLMFYLECTLLTALVLGLTVALATIGGDLFESILKRENNVKESGRIIPGHGGIFDRVDGLIAAAPIFWLQVQWYNCV